MYVQIFTRGLCSNFELQIEYYLNFTSPSKITIHNYRHEYIRIKIGMYMGFSIAYVTDGNQGYFSGRFNELQFNNLLAYENAQNSEENFTSVSPFLSTFANIFNFDIFSITKLLHFSTLEYDGNYLTLIILQTFLRKLRIKSF